MLRIPEEYLTALEQVVKTTLSGARPEKRFLHRVAESVTKLSHGLTKSREEFIEARYLRDDAAQEAYLTYFMTTNLLKLWPPLRELRQSGFFDGRSTLRTLDLGSGTGTAVWSEILFLLYELEDATSHVELNFTLTDALQENLKNAERFSRMLLPQVGARFKGSFVQFDLARPSVVPERVRSAAPYDLITMMNVVNELDEANDEELIQTILSLLAPDGALVMIEPASKEQSRRALRFRDRMIQASGDTDTGRMHVFAPCTRRGGCPALREEDNWCHAEVPWERPAFIKAIDDVTGNLRLSLKYTYTTFLDHDLNLSDLYQPERNFVAVGRIVSEVFKEKGRTRMAVCNQHGRREYIVNKRDVSDATRDVSRANRYDLVGLSGEEVRAHDVKIGEGGSFHILSNASGAPSVDKWGSKEGVEKIFSG